MSLELLQSIEKAEARAEEIRADAQREAREMIKSVEEVCVTNERSAVMDHRTLSQGILEEARGTAQKRIAAMEEKEAQTRGAITAAARKNLDRAADLIFERVVQHGHR